MSSEGTEHREHETPTCPTCGSNRTRPLDDRVAVCFDCDDEWILEGGGDEA